MKNRWTLKNKKALVTGATRGIGRAITEEFLELGAEVFVVSRNLKDVDKMVKSYKDKGFKITGMQCDVSDKSEREDLFKRIKKDWGSLEILINNAGTNTRKKTLENSDEDFDKLMNLNMNSVFDLCKKFHPLLKKSGKGSIVNITSVAGITCVGTGSPYAMTKAAINHLTRYLSVEWAEDKIRVNAVAPWYIKTSLTMPVLKDPLKLKAILDCTPMKRAGEPVEVSAVAAFLSMDAASFITGEIIAADGGFLKYGL
ncbi:MAG TPA: SDR family oxidoreductase [Ignavibacteria bacterium]|nr:SDR family oxidoreductase [Ignavibacteria bacterium]HMR39107.1 SDR family oxidoreductase [Ignavibacteria bacterium]